MRQGAALLPTWNGIESFGAIVRVLTPNCPTYATRAPAGGARATQPVLRASLRTSASFGRLAARNCW